MMRKKGFLIIAIITIIVAGIFLDAVSYLDAALDGIRDLGTTGIVLFLALYILATVLFVPGSALTLGAGAIYGVIEGSIIVSLASTTGAGLAFLAGRYLARGWIEAKIEGNTAFASVDEAVAGEGWRIVLLTRLSPIFPFNLLNYAYGVTKVSFSEYLAASWIGMIPGTVMYVYLGSIAGDIAAAGHAAATGAGAVGAASGAGLGSPEVWTWALRIIGLAATIGVTIYVTRIAKAALAERTAQDQNRVRS